MITVAAWLMSYGLMAVLIFAGAVVLMVLAAVAAKIINEVTG